MDEGFVYVLSNRSMPGLLKIGYTRKVVDERIVELSSVTGIPTPFVLEYYVFTERPDYWESRLHKELARYRVTDGREFFKVSFTIAAECIDRLVKPKKHVFSREAYEVEIADLRATQNEAMRHEQARREKELKEQEQVKTDLTREDRLREQEREKEQRARDSFAKREKIESNRLIYMGMTGLSCFVFLAGGAMNSNFLLIGGALGVLIGGILTNT